MQALHTSSQNSTFLYSAASGEQSEDDVRDESQQKLPAAPQSQTHAHSSKSIDTNTIKDANINTNKRSHSNTQANRDDVMNQKKAVMNHESIAIALRLTCELNRQLSTGEPDPTSIFYSPPHQRKINIGNDNDNDNDKGGESDDNGDGHLSKWILHLSQCLKYHDDPYIPAITMVYLDRACSEATFRPDVYHDHDGYGHGHGEPSTSMALSCPHLNASNVHKLYLAANVLALRTYRNEWPVVLSRGCFHDDITAMYCKALNAASKANARENADNDLGDDHNILSNLTPFELGNLMEWMVSSLGANGLAIEVEEATRFIEHWKQLFTWESVQ